MALANKDVQIARQSNLTKSIEILNGQNIRPDVQLVIKIAEALTDYVQFGLEDSVINKTKQIDVYLKECKRKPPIKTIITDGNGK